MSITNVHHQLFKLCCATFVSELVLPSHAFHDCPSTLFALPCPVHSTMVALQTLYKEGGIPRFYNGLAPALIQVHGLRAHLSRLRNVIIKFICIAWLLDVSPTQVGQTQSNTWGDR